MRRVPISSIADVNPRTPAQVLSEPEQMVSFVPMAVVGEDGRLGVSTSRPAREVMKGYSPFRRGDVIVAKITPCLENGKAAHVVDLPHEFAFGSTEFHVLRPGPDVDARYLFFAVWNPAFRELAQRSMTGSAGQQRTPAHVFDRFHVPLPSLKEQRRIAALLDEADALRRKRRESLKLLDDLLRSTFLQMVGSCHRDHGSWPKRRIEQLAAPGPNSMRTGPFGSALRHSEFVDEGIAVLGIDNAVQNRFAWDERRFITKEKYEGLRRYTVHPGDVIITIMGTNGRSAVVPDDIPLAITTKHLATITVDKSIVHPEFLSHAIHLEPALLRQVTGRSRGAIMDGLNLGLIRELELHLPPLAQQLKFAKAVAAFRANTAQQETGCNAGDRLFTSLLHTAFADSRNTRGQDRGDA